MNVVCRFCQPKNGRCSTPCMPTQRLRTRKSWPPTAWTFATCLRQASRKPSQNPAANRSRMISQPALQHSSTALLCMRATGRTRKPLNGIEHKRKRRARQTVASRFPLTYGPRRLSGTTQEQVQWHAFDNRKHYVLFVFMFAGFGLW